MADSYSCRLFFGADNRLTPIDLACDPAEGREGEAHLFVGRPF